MKKNHPNRFNGLSILQFHIRLVVLLQNRQSGYIHLKAPQYIMALVQNRKVLVQIRSMTWACAINNKPLI